MGTAYVHKTTVGVSSLQQGAMLYADHDVTSRVLVASANGDQATQFLGCGNDLYQVHVQKGTGRTKPVCTNENTACSCNVAAAGNFLQCD